MNSELKIISAGTAVGLLIGILFAINIGIKKQERWECAKWQRASEVYENYFSPSWAIEQCKSYGIKL